MQDRTRQRDQALARLSRITTATAVAGTFATVGFGGLAAITYTGTTTDSDTVNIDGTSSDDQQGQVTTEPTPTPRTSTKSGTVTPPTVTRGRSHVRTGGS